MFNLKDETYAVLEFVTVDGYYTDIETVKSKLKVHLYFPTIIEIAAVKIANGKIVGHYSTFVAIDGCEEHDIKLEDESPEAYGITAEHLIGAPSLYDAIERLFRFTRGCTLITKYSINDSRNPLRIIKKYIEPVYIFNNPALSINKIIAAIQIKESCINAETEISKTDAYNLALSLEDRELFYDLISNYLDCDAESSRQDSLSRALLVARLFIALSNEKPKLAPIDEDAPF